MRVSFKRLLPSTHNTHTHTSLFLPFLTQLDLRQNQDESFSKRMFLHRPRNVCVNKRHCLDSRVCVSASIGSPRSLVCLTFCVGSQVWILLMLQQAGDWQIHLLVMDDHPILGKQTKLPVDPVVKQYYILIRLYSMESQLGLKRFFFFSLTAFSLAKYTAGDCLSSSNHRLKNMLVYTYLSLPLQLNLSVSFSGCYVLCTVYYI